MPMKIALTGATGFIGTKLVAALIARGDQVTVLSRDAVRARDKVRGATIVEADLEHEGAWQAALDGVDAIIHLAGEPIAGKRWDARQKQILRDSRIESTRHIVEAIGKAVARPRVLISASGVDYYPFAQMDLSDFDDDDVTEQDPAGEDSSRRVCCSARSHRRKPSTSFGPRSIRAATSRSMARRCSATRSSRSGSARSSGGGT